jgi:hypothetical protein
LAAKVVEALPAKSKKQHKLIALKREDCFKFKPFMKSMPLNRPISVNNENFNFRYFPDNPSNRPVISFNEEKG